MARPIRARLPTAPPNLRQSVIVKIGSKCLSKLRNVNYNTDMDFLKGVKIDVVHIDGYSGLYVNGELVLEGKPDFWNAASLFALFGADATNHAVSIESAIRLGGMHPESLESITEIPFSPDNDKDSYSSPACVKSLLSSCARVKINGRWKKS